MTAIRYHQGPSDPTPQQRLLLMSDTEWEMFIEECVIQLREEGLYTQVLRLGAAGDKGRDVCGYTIHPPTEGTWDLYQAKHYNGTLSRSEFAPELAKFLASVYDGLYPRPRCYYVCALKSGTSLIDLILNPDSMRSWIIDEWKKKKGKFGTITRELSDPFEAFILGFPFDIVRRKTSEELLGIHSRNSERHWACFGRLDKRGDNPPVPEQPDPAVEQKYIEALIHVYAEAEGSDIKTADHIPEKYSEHFKVQRRLFYCAEGLNRFSRDKLPGAFEDLLDQIELGVASTVSAPHESGMERLTETLNTANQLPIAAHPLNARLVAGDLQGSCHHLANQERIQWVGKYEKK